MFSNCFDLVIFYYFKGQGSIKINKKCKNWKLFKIRKSKLNGRTSPIFMFPCFLLLCDLMLFITSDM